MKKLTWALMGVLALAGSSLAATTPAAATDAATTAVAANTSATPKIGVIELGEVLKADPEMNQLKKQLETQFKPRMDKIAAVQQNLKQDTDKMTRDAAVMSQADKDALTDKIGREQRDLSRMQQDYYQDARVAQNEAMSKVLKRVDAIVAQVAKSQNLDLIFQRENVAYHSARVDITQSVIAQMKAQKATS